MKNYLLFLSLLIVGCGTGKAPEKKFEGTFFGESNGVQSTVVFSVDGKQLTGSLDLGGQPARLSGQVSGEEASGNLHDEETGKDYRFQARLTGEELRLSVTFPELNNQALEFVMRRQQSAGSSKSGSGISKGSDNSKERDNRLLGTWRHSEVLSSNSGGSYMSLATDYFIRFLVDGTVLSWMGSSAGMGGSGGGSEENPEKGQWFTRGDRLVFKDPATGQEAETTYSVSETGLLLSNGSEKKIYERIN